MRIHPFQNRRLLLPFAIAVLICQSSIARAATTITVTSGADSGGACPGANCTLRQAIATSVSGDTINFSASVTKVSLTSAQLLIEHELTISGPGPGLLEVTRASGANFGIFKISNSSTSGPAVSISGIAITNGLGGFGDGGVGGGIFNDNSKLSVTNCIISRNTALLTGGGIGSFGGTLTVDGCTFSNNGAFYTGGGIRCSGGTMIVRNSTLSGNSAGPGDPDPNQSGGPGRGGGISVGSATATVSNCTLSGNSATTTTTSGFPSYGGGIVHGGNSTLTLRNCTLSGNSASGGGGGIYNEGGTNNVATLTVSNSTVSGNSAPSGGGIYNTGTSGGNAFAKLDNTILQAGSSGANLVNVGSGTSITSEGYNLSTDNGGGFLTAAGDQINTNPKLGPLQDNGGPTFTMALLPGSPAIDKGYSFGVATDQRGVPRPIDIASIPNANGGDGSDIGAFEVDTNQTGPTFVVTTTADHDDGSCSVGDCTLREAINASNSASGANSIVFQNGLTGTITLQSALGTLTITDSVTITGPGARALSVSGNNALRVFYFSSGISAISGLTIRDGNATATSSGNGMRGGGIFNAGNATLTISDCTLYNNRVQGANNTTTASGAGGFGDGGAICNSGNLTVSRCTLALNSAIGGFGADASGAMGANLRGGDGGSALGAAIFNDTTGTLTMSDSTLATNLATGGAAGKGQFGGNGGAATGGVFNNGMIIVTAATLSNNVATGGAGGKGNNSFNGGSVGVARGGLATGSGTSVVRDTISAGNVGNGNVGSDAGGAFSSQGYNLIGAGDASTGFTATGDQIGTSAAPVNAKLGTLQNNFGNTDTFALLSGSPAIDAGKAFGLSTDQRGLNRLVGTAVAGGDGSDIGAFEVQTATPPTPTPTATPTGTPTATPGLVANVSTRLPVGTGDNVLIEGFVVQGPAGSTKKIIVRAIGPFLASFGITDALANPTLEIHDAGNGNAIVAMNDDWKVTQVGGLITAGQSAEISASGFAPSNDLESAIIANLPPGSYTAVVRGVGNSVGTGVVDAYDLSAGSSAKLVNVATRGLIQPGDKLMIAGFITQNGPVRAVVRAIGPSLAAFGITNALPDTTLQLRDTNGAIVVENDDWKVRTNGTSQQAELEATGLQPTNDLEAAVLVILPPGQYSAQVRGKPETTGIGVVQVYFLQ